MTSRHSSLESSLGYRFHDPALLKAALTPPSAGMKNDNQRLEFLGDSILYICASLMVFREHPDWEEGALSKLRGMMVCTEALADWALDMKLALETGPRSSRRPVPGGGRKALADAVEAILAAVYLDALKRGHYPMASASRIV